MLFVHKTCFLTNVSKLTDMYLYIENSVGLSNEMKDNLKDNIMPILDNPQECKAFAGPQAPHMV